MTGLTEATLRLDQLDGFLAEMFARRLALHERVDLHVLAAWHRLAQHVDVAELVAGYRASIGLLEAASEADAAHEAMATAAAIRALQKLADLVYDEDDADDLELVRRALENAIRSGRAEGIADVVMMAADELGKTGMHTLAIDFQIAFEHAYRALEQQAEALAGQGGDWLAKILGDQAKEIGRLLGGLTRSGASYEDMVRAVQGVLTGADGRAVRTIVDLLTSRAMSRGALDLYASEAVAQVDFVTAGDARVCPTCEDLEAHNPYTVADSPVPGIHPFCRCVLMPTSILPAATVDAYLGGGSQ